jgi:hypothetical protein
LLGGSCPEQVARKKFLAVEHLSRYRKIPEQSIDFYELNEFMISSSDLNNPFGLIEPGDSSGLDRL